MNVITAEKPAIGHNTGGIAGEHLTSIVNRIEALEVERKERSADIADVFKEAGSAGFDVKVLRQLIRIRRMEPAELENEEALIALYKHAVGMR